MNKKRVLICLCVLLFVSGGGLAYTHFTPSHSKKETTSTLKKSETPKQTEKKPKEEKTRTSSPASKQSKQEKSSIKIKKETQAFNKAVLEQDYYLEQVDPKGTLTYVKATPQALEALEKKAGTDHLSTYQTTNKEGQLIQVLTLPEGK